MWQQLGVLPEVCGDHAADPTLPALPSLVHLLMGRQESDPPPFTFSYFSQTGWIQDVSRAG